jgi:hypothetical protein
MSNSNSNSNKQQATTRRSRQPAGGSGRQQWQWQPASGFCLAGRLVASSENKKPFSLHPLRSRSLAGRYALHATRRTPPAKLQISNFLGLRRCLITTAQATHN